MNSRQAHLVFADGTRFAGRAFGAAATRVGEVVFMTGMTGYQEVLTDASYCGQIVVMTAAHVGNTGVNSDDEEAARPFLAGFVVRELAAQSSNWRSQAQLDAYLEQHGVAGLADVDTRALTRYVREHGAQLAAVGCEDVATLHDLARQAPSMQGQNLTEQVTTREPYVWSEGLGTWSEGADVRAPAATSSDDAPHVVALDFGIKRSMLRCLVEAGCKVTVMPAASTAQTVLDQHPDGIFLSNGPGDPAAVQQGLQTTRELLGKRPIFGICLGHQILCTALGGTTSKLKFGHHGLNHPVRDERSGRVEITSQNHGFVVDLPSLAGKCELTHVNLNDGTCEGIAQPEASAFGVQYHPEAGAGPHDSRHLFRRFVDSMRSFR